jgi:ribosome maturation factor RimP
MSAASARSERIASELEPLLAAADLILEDLSVTAAGNRRLIRVLVDRQLREDGPSTEPVQPMDLDEIAEITREISAHLDAGDVMGEAPYVLEVSSPGVDRPLTLARHFRRNIGRLVKAQLQDAATVTGRIVSADDNGFTLLVEGTGKSPAAEQIFRYQDCVKAQVQVEFNRPGAAYETDDQEA